MKTIKLTLLCIATIVCSLSLAAQNSIENAPLYGKTLNIIGDSYVRNHLKPYTETWHYKIAQKYNMTYNNYGINGNCIAYDRTHHGFGIPMYERYTQMADGADYVIVMGGHNDAGLLNEMGGIEVFKEKLAVLCEGLINKYPGAKIAFISSWNVPREGFPEMLAALKEVCGEFSIPVYDAATQSGIHVRNENFRKKYFQSPNDTAHLNEEGHNLFMNRIETFLLGL